MSNRTHKRRIGTKRPKPKRVPRLHAGIRRVDSGLFLSVGDTARLQRALDKLRFNGLEEYALTGSLALETNLCLVGRTGRSRDLHDLDIVVDSFGSIPRAIASSNLLVRHFHPKATEGKMLIQLVDPEQALRIDVFRSYGETLQRSQPVYLGASKLRVVSLEDLAARAASLVLGLDRGATVPRKHAEDFQRLVGAIDKERTEIVWPEHRNQNDPATFREAAIRIGNLVQSHRDLLIIPEYSHDVDALCLKCQEIGPFRLASPALVMSILGYC